MITFYVPPGIGDFSAMYAKLCTINRPMTIRVANDPPFRLEPFLDCLPKIINGGRAGHSAGASLAQTLPPGTDISSLPDGDYFLAINNFLEDGGKVADWIPGTTAYHYALFQCFYMYKPDIAREFLRSYIPFKSPRVGIYCSAYGNSRHWGFWTFKEWSDFISLISKRLPPETEYFMIGAEYDTNISEVVFAWMKESGINAHLLLGQHHIGDTIEIIRQLDYFFSFPSGLGFLADAVDTPSMMWFPRNLNRMMNTFVDPENVSSGKTLHVPFETPQESYIRFTYQIKHLEEQWKRRNENL